MIFEISDHMRTFTDGCPFKKCIYFCEIDSTAPVTNTLIDSTQLCTIWSVVQYFFFQSLTGHCLRMDMFIFNKCCIAHWKVLRRISMVLLNPPSLPPSPSPPLPHRTTLSYEPVIETSVHFNIMPIKNNVSFVFSSLLL